MSYCTNCGAALAPDARFCTSCGTPPPGKQRRAGVIILCVVAGLIGLGLVATAIGSMRGGDAESEEYGDRAARRKVGAEPAGVQCNDTKPTESPSRPTFQAPPPMTIDPAKKYTATMETSCGKITIDLDPRSAPMTVNSFVFLAKQKYFDGLTFHRVVKDFVIQGGDPEGTGVGGPGYDFEDELPQDGYKIGSLAMANAGPDTNGSQFFIVTGNDGTQLPGKYSHFGMVTSGIEVAQKLEAFAQNPPDPQGKPSRPLYIFNITIQES